MSKTLRAPWRKFYGEEKEHLEYPDFSAYKLIEYTASKHLNNISYNYYGTKKTYHEFLKQIDDTARAMKSIGIKHKDVVSICMPNTPEGIISFYAANKIGAIASMIHPLSAENEIKHYLNISKTEWLITIDFTIEKVAKVINDTKVKKVITVGVGESMPLTMKSLYAATNVPKTIMSLNPMNYLNEEYNKTHNKIMTWKEFIKKGKEYQKEIEDDFKGKDIAAILYSGGTTGTPKGVKLTNLNLNASAMQNFEHVACLKDKDKVLAIMPIFHGFGLEVSINDAFCVGAKVVIVPTFKADEFDKLLTKYKPSVLVGVPTLFEAMTNNTRMENVNLSNLKF